MYTSNTIHRINKNNPVEMNRNGTIAYKVPLQFPVIVCIKYMYFILRFLTIANCFSRLSVKIQNTTRNHCLLILIYY